MGNNYSEDKLIEQTCIDIFKNQIEWEVANVFKGETFGVNGTLGRESEADVLLKARFFEAIKKLNPNLPQQAYDLAFELINEDDVTKDIAEQNHEKYNFLKQGIPVTFKNDKGEIIRNKKIKVFDFENPQNNNFLAVQQLWVEGKSKRRRRPDIVGFVNGIPLLFIELKAHHRKLKVAFETNLKDYKDVIPKMFHTNAVIILSNGFESMIGAITSKFEHFHEWKRIEENQEGIISLDTILKGVCEKTRFVDLFENFILFDNSIGSIVKLIARNHQFIGVNKAVQHFKKQRGDHKKGLLTKEEAQKLGVFWHTQGSGKSYSMVFLCQKILRELGGGYTFLLITDRTELDNQIYATFSGVGAVTNANVKATSGENLKELLKTDQRYIFSLIHKFNFDEVITERNNIIVISDEAHRTQGGSLAMNLRLALPNASFIGFTGTPLFKDDELTKRIFGDYVSTYDFKRSVEDGATVPLYYENRGEKLRLDNPLINDQIREAIEEEELDDDQRDKLQKLFQREYPILTAEKRLRSIAKDVVYHFNNRGYKGKALFVALDKVTAVKMYNYITEEWNNYVLEKEKEINSITELQEQITAQNQLKWTKETEISVVVSGEQNEIDKFRGWGLDIEPHRLKMNTRDLEKEFKEEENPFRLAIVCAMWITGFDVKSLSTLYIDKPLKSHTLMQTIARANRVHEGKNNGLIVDYIETYKALLEALAVYGSSSGKGDTKSGEPETPIRPLEDLIAELDETITATELFLKDECKFDLKLIIDAEDNLYRIKYIRDAYDAICISDEARNKFGVLAREVFKKYKALMPDESIFNYRDKRDSINAVYAMMIKNIDEADITPLIAKIQNVVNESVNTLDILMEKSEAYGTKIDLSGLDFVKIQEEFLKPETRKNIMIQELKDRINKKLEKLLAQNPLRVDFYEKYQEIIEQYNLGKEYASVKELFDNLIKLFGELTEEEKRAKKEELTEDELAVFDLLNSGKKVTDKEKVQLRETAIKLLNSLKENEFKVTQWASKTQTSSAVKKSINNYLFELLPYPTYEDGDIAVKTELLFDFFKTQYGNYNSVA